jgi:hypothetical protein
MEPNPGDNQQVGVANTSPEKTLKEKPCEELIGAEAETRFKPKRTRGGLIPPKRKSVKRIIFDSIVEDISSVFCFCSSTSTSSSSAAPQQLAHSDKALKK